MNDQHLHNRPRFDAPSRVPPAVRLRELLQQPDPPEPEALAHEADEWVVDMPAPPGEICDVIDAQPLAQDQPGLEELEAALLSLSDSIFRLEDKARTQTDQLVRAFVAQLFPRLSDLFLAEEVSRQLPELLPNILPQVEIRAEPGFAGRLQQCVARSTSLSSQCAVIEDESLAVGSIDVSFEDGGLSFDFDAMLKACLARLDGHSKQEEA